MKRLIEMVVLGFLTVGSFALTVPSKATAMTSESTVIKEVFPEASTTKPELDIQPSQPVQEEQITHNIC